MVILKHLYFFLTCLCLCLCTTLLAQDKTLRHEISLGGGVFLERGTNAQHPGISLRTNYGLDIALGKGWSVMPGIGARAQLANLSQLHMAGAENDGLAFADINCQGRYTIGNKTASVVLGLGPVLSLALNQEKYGMSSYPYGPSGKNKFHSWDIGVLPSVSVYLWDHLLVRLDAIIGLKNMLRHYGDASKSSTYMTVIDLSVGYRF